MTSTPTAPPVEAGRAADVPGRPARRRRRRIGRFSPRDIAVIGLLLGLPLLLDLALIWGPALASIGLSFTSWDGLGEIRPVGLDNYVNIVSNYPPFWPAVWHNLLWLAFLGLVATPFGLFLAVLLDREMRFTRFYQTAFYLPVVLSLAVVGFLAQLIFSRDYGAANALLGRADNPVDWLGDPSINLWSVLLLVGWRHVGYVMLLYLAGLKAVDPALKEAAAIDGANEPQTFFRVVFPTLRPVNVIVLVITVIEALRAFDIVYAINRGRNGLELLSVLVTDNIVGEASRIGYGSAIAVILLLISTGFIAVYLVQVFRREDEA
ncbi:ABC transporter permease [Plantactinospora sp. BC1]|uniref:carbohydrate ABC transporter permease n=1 Tax=Plantactinospora sp. BC1 TaxID=2108470 RepID=UPI000D16FAD1|nr:sugar ABC transporter permease [Plantactinospora sp. BC1]AVT32302.1 ABC transporter permease [Plantactinospora sp. BC1]